MSAPLRTPSQPGGFPSLEDSPIARQWIAEFEKGLGELPDRLEGGEIETVYRFMHDAKGLGPTFGYTLIGQIGGRVADALRDASAPLNERERGAVLAAHAALSFIVSKNIKGDGGEAGAAILAKIDAIAG